MALTIPLGIINWRVAERQVAEQLARDHGLFIISVSSAALNIAFDFSEKNSTIFLLVSYLC
jgi:hypothetical protein